MLLAGALLLAGNGAVFGRALGFGFVDWDDPVYVLENPVIRDLSWVGVRRLFTSFVSGNYHPLTLLTYAAQYRWGGLDPVVFHATNLVLHSANAVLVCLLLFEWVGRLPAAAWAAAAFSLHPMRVEPVCWVSGTKDLLAGFFLLISLLAYGRREHGRSGVAYGLSVGAFGLAGLAKATVVAAGVFFPLADFARGETGWGNRRRYLPYVGISLALGLAAVAARRSYQEVLVEDYSSGGFVVLEGLWRLFVYYGARQGAWSAPWFSPYFGDDSGRRVEALVLAAVGAAVAVLLTVLFRNRRDRKPLVFGVSFFVVSLLPALFVPVVGYSADRFAYVPTVGLAYLGALAVDRAWTALAGTKRVLLAAGLTVLLVVEGGLSCRRTEVWRDSIRCWTGAVATFPERPGSLLNRANALAERGQAYAVSGLLDASLRDLDAAARLMPRGARIRGYRAETWLRTGDEGRALADWDEALSLEPDNVDFLLRRGRLLRQRGDFRGATRDFGRMLAVQGPTGRVLGERALTFRLAGDLRAAVGDYNASVRLEPGNWVLWFNRALARRDGGDEDGWLQDLLEAAARGPEAWQPRYHLGLYHLRRGDPTTALGEFNAALSLSPEAPPVLKERAKAYEALGRFERARADEQRVQRVERSVERQGKL